MNKKILFFILILCIIPLIKADPLKVDSQIDLKVPFDVEGSPANSSATCNITVRYPNETLLLSNTPMNLVSNGIFNVTFNITKIGTYSWDAFCCQMNKCASGEDTFEVNPSGTQPSTTQGIIYFGAFFIVFALFLLSLYGAVKIPWANGRDQEGRIVSMNDLKYVKLILWFVTYLIFLFLLVIGKSISTNFLFFNESSKFFEVMFIIFLALALPLTVVTMFITIIAVMADKKTYRLISRGFSAT